MKIEALRIKNFKAFREVEMQDIPDFCVIVGQNGTGKSTLFNIFGFLKDALETNVTTALIKQGGSRGFQEVRSRNSEGPIEIEIKFREKQNSTLVTYFLQINEQHGKPIVEREILSRRRASGGQLLHFLDFSEGKGVAVINDLESVRDVSGLKREEQSLKSSDILAVKGLAQFERFQTVVALGSLIENLHVSDFTLSKAMPEQGAGYAEHLLCIEEPEKSLYPKLLRGLTEEFRAYSERGGQVFVSTHSPDFLDATQLEEVFCLVKENGYTEIKRASQDAQIIAYLQEGGQMGELWRQGFL